jgi:hypothetical protein
MLRRLVVREWVELHAFEFPESVPAAVVTRAWGPVEKVQFDHKNQAIQTYRSVLLADAGGSWLLLMDTVNALTAEHSVTVILPKQQLPAQEWLCNNGFIEEAPSALFEI